VGKLSGAKITLLAIKTGYTVEENVRGNIVLQKWLNEGRYD